MHFFSLPGFLLLTLSLSSAACAQDNDTLFLADAQAARLADGNVATTVTVQCSGDCSAEAAHCAQVTWQNVSGVSPVTLDVSQTCSTTAPSGSATESLVVTSKVPVPHDSSITGIVELDDTSGQRLAGGSTALGGDLPTEFGITDP
jgi:hypothetical protein